jgi:flagellar M-ring protein FliF
MRNLGTVRLIAMGGVAVGLIVFFIFLSTRLSGDDMTLLYGNLEPGDSSRIVAKLQSMGVPYELAGNGQEINVPSEDALRLRVQMAEEGLAGGGTVGYEIFDRSESLGTTNFVQNINLVRALEGELARTIRAIQQVQDARVHIVLPKREVFSRRTQPASASVVVKTRGNERLGKSQVLAIQQIVSASVPGLDPEHISVIDHRGRLLARAGSGEDNGEIIASENEEFTRDFERRTVATIEELLEQSVGIGKIRAQVTAEFDFDRITTSTESFDPEGQVVRSTQTVEEEAQSSDTDSQANVSVANNLPDGGTPAAGASGTASTSSRTEETVNYEITKTVKSHVRETGTVRRLSVAVLVDGVSGTDEDGNPTWQPRGEEELKKLETLVKSAIGYDEERGDTVQVVNMRFTAADNLELDDVSPLLGLTKGDYFRIAEIFVLAIVGILVILLVVRPLVARTLDALPSALDAATQKALLSDQSEEAAALAGPSGTGVTAMSDESEESINLDQVEGKVKTSTLKKIAEIVERHPEETVSILRQWMYQET